LRVRLDTNVVSEVRRSNADPLVVQRVRAIGPQDAFLSSITIGELAYGAKRLPAGARRRDLEVWIASLQQAYASRILPVEAATAEIWGELTAACEAAGRVLAPQDGLIAATALRHGLHLMTRNTKDFIATGALLINPWEP
jgi:predicted nucleic acid-binding protein